MSVRITIECDDYYVSASLSNLRTQIEESDILEPVYNKGKKTNYVSDHFKAHIKYVKDKE